VPCVTAVHCWPCGKQWHTAVNSPGKAGTPPVASKLTVLAAPPGSGKTDRLLDRYRKVLAAARPGAAVWLAPNWRAVAELRARLLAGLGHGCFSPGVMTFDQFAEAVLEVAPAAVRPLSRWMKRQLVRQLIQQQRSQGRLSHFRPIAETSGLVDLVCELIGELKRLEIWPEHFREACNARGITLRDTEFLEIYDEYQRCLREHQLYDAEGRFWSARDRLSQGQQRPFEHLRLMVADGFTDFTRTQHEILEILAQRVEEVWVTLPLEAEPGREALFAKPLKTLEELRRRHPCLAVEKLPRPQRPPWPAMAHLERTLFANPRHAQPAEDLTGVEILAAAQQLGEIQLIGSRIKRLLVEGDGQLGGRPVRPDEIAVVFRSPEEASPLVGEVFEALGIPFALETGLRLDRSPVLAALVALLRLDLDDWPFAQLVSVLGSNYFQPAWPGWQDGKTAAAAERTLRRLQIPSGRKQLLEELSSIASAGGGANGDRGDEAGGRAQRTLAVLERLAAAFDELPQETGPAGWGQAWARLARQIGMLRAMELGEGEVPPAREHGRPPAGEGHGGPTPRRPAAPRPAAATAAPFPDRRAWEQLQRGLAAGDTLARWMGQRPVQWDRRAAFDALWDFLSTERVGPAEDESGRVRILSAASARALRIPCLFLAGLSEKAFPPAHRVDRLYSEPEYQRLIDEGLPLAARTDRNREEMLLFYETVTRATRRLYLSYPALDESAQPLSASPYLDEMEQACGGRTARTVSADLSPIPTGDEPLSAAEFRVQAVATAREGNVSLLAGLVQHQPAVAENVLAGLQLIDLRQDRRRFGPAEGMLSGDAVRRELSARFSPQQTFSATTLEQYASCPYRFFLEHVLGLEPIEELVLAMDYLGRGRLAHEALAAFHRRVNQLLGRPASPLELDPAEYDRLRLETLEELLREEIRNPVQAALREVDRRLVDGWLAAYRDQHAKYDALWKQCDTPLVPEFFEVSFGGKAEGLAPPSTGRPLEFLADEETIGISGRIDRIDTGQLAGKTVFNVLDYKTGNPIKFDQESVEAGTTLQLPLYAIAITELILSDRDSIPWQAGYWYLKERGFKQALRMYQRTDGSLVPADRWEEIRGGLARTVANLVRGIRSGEFPVYSRDDRCTGYCPYKTVCRVNQVRSLEKTW
jgi:ATP-dependent helicase/nuclease subunit B